MEVSARVFPAIKVFGSYNTSLRMPTFTDLYYTGPTNIGNSELKPEKSASIEGGLKWDHPFIQGHWVVFSRQGKDIIDWVKSENEDLWQPQNLTRVNSLGTEILAQINLKKKFGDAFPNRVSISYFYNHLEKEKIDLISNYVLDNIKNKLVGSVNQSITKNISLDFKLIYQDREGTYTQFVNEDWGSEVQYEPFWTFDAKIVYAWQNLNLYVSVNNLFDVSYFDIGNVAQPGRWVKTGIFYRLDFN
jgi:iron complex outermembrane receptor protein